MVAVTLPMQGANVWAAVMLTLLFPDFSFFSITVGLIQNLPQTIYEFMMLPDFPFLEYYCPKHSHYKHDIRTCPATCLDREPTKACNEEPMEGCVCNAGFVWSGDKCIPAKTCGCPVKDEDGTTVYDVSHWNRKFAMLTALLVTGLRYQHWKGRWCLSIVVCNFGDINRHWGRRRTYAPGNWVQVPPIHQVIP